MLEGSSSVDESMITGESMPTMKQAGATVIGGTINRSGSFVMRADRTGADGMLAHIIEMVAAAQRCAPQSRGWQITPLGLYPP